MKQDLIGFDKNNNPTLVFFDIQDFEEQSIRDMTVLTFSEDEVEYTYFGTNGKDFKEAHKIAPDFDHFEVMSEKEAKKRGLLKSFPSQNTQGLEQGGNLDAKIVQLPDGKMVSINDIMKMSPEQKKEIEDQIKKSINNVYKESLTEAKETYYITTLDGSFKAVNGTKLSNGFFAYKSDVSGWGYAITDTASGLLLANRIRTIKDCKEFINNMSDKAKQSLENVRKGQDYLAHCKKLAKYKSEQEGK